MPAVEGGTLAPAARRTAPLGMVLFLASELMFFGGLFAAYFTLRSLTAEWPPPDVHLEMPLTVTATVLLTSSSFTMHRGVRAEGGRPWLVVTLALGAAFLAIKGYELSAAGFSVSSHAYGSLFFTMLGAHAVHLVVGMLLIVYLFRRAAGDGVPDAVGYYWHFVDVVWLAIFGTVYLVR